MLFVATVAAMSVNAQGSYDLSLVSKVNIGAQKDQFVASTVDNDGVVVIKTGDKVANNWDNQFFVSAPEVIAVGTPFTFSMDVKSVSATVFSSQTHNNPGDYVGNLSFNVATSAEWSTYTAVGVVAGSVKTLAFNLNDGDGAANEFQFKNITWAPFSASYTVDTLTFNYNGDLKAENFMVFTSSVSTTASEFNSVSASLISSVSSTVAFSSVSTTVFASVSKTLIDNKTITPVDFELDGNKLKLANEFGENDSEIKTEVETEGKVNFNSSFLIDALNYFVVKAQYVKPTVNPAVNENVVAEFSVYPNPVNDVLNVACEAGVANVAIFDVAGRMVKVSNEDVINVADLKAGLYIVKVTDMNGANGTTKIMK